MNTLLASSRTLSLKVYTTVTGVSLFKLMYVPLYSYFSSVTLPS